MEFSQVPWYLLIHAVLILLVMGILLRLVRVGADRIERNLVGALDDIPRQNRLHTLLTSGVYILRVVIVVSFGLMLFLTLGFDITPVLASVGVVGLAVSLGAQALIKDYLSGVLILSEDQFRVGEQVQIGSVSGSVEQITLRSTILRDLHGQRVVIPNGDVRTVTNASRGWARAVVDVNIPFDADLGQVVRALEAGMQQAAADSELSAIWLEAPQVQGWNSFNEWAVQMRLVARIPAGRQAEAAVALRRFALEALQQAGVRVALPAQRVMQE